MPRITLDALTRAQTWSPFARRRRFALHSVTMAVRTFPPGRSTVTSAFTGPCTTRLTFPHHTFRALTFALWRPKQGVEPAHVPETPLEPFDEPLMLALQDAEQPDRFLPLFRQHCATASDAPRRPVDERRLRGIVHRVDGVPRGLVADPELAARPADRPAPVDRLQQTDPVPPDERPVRAPHGEGRRDRDGSSRFLNVSPLPPRRKRAARRPP